MQRLFKCTHKGCGEIFTNEKACLDHEKQHKNSNLVLAYKLYVNEDCKIIMTSKCFTDKRIIGECFIKHGDNITRPSFYCYYEKANQQEDALKNIKEFIKEYIKSLHRNINNRLDIV